MPRWRVACEDGSTIWVDADTKEGVLRHLGHPSTVNLKGLKIPRSLDDIVVETDPSMPPLLPPEQRVPVTMPEDGVTAPVDAGERIPEKDPAELYAELRAKTDKREGVVAPPGTPEPTEP